MEESLDPLDSWSYNLSNRALDSSASGTSFKNDFIPRYHQNELVTAAMDTGHVVFLPKEQDKLHFILQLLKRVGGELHRNMKCVFCVVNSIERGRRMTSFLRKHVDLDVTLLTNLQNNDCSSIRCLVYCPGTLDSPIAENAIENIIRNLSFLILDDCVYSMTEHPMKEVTLRFLAAREQRNFKVIGLTSALIHHDVPIDGIYDYFVQMEKMMKSVIITSHDCRVVNKYLSSTIFKRVKYTRSEKWLSRSDAEKISHLVEYLYTLINRLKYNDSERNCVRTGLQSILDNFKKVSDSHGLYPSLVTAGLSRIALERLKLLCTNDSLFVTVCAIITDFSVISAWLESTIRTSGSLKDASVIKNSCDGKIIRTWSLLSKIEPEKNCIIFVHDTITAQMLAYVLQELSSSEKKSQIGFVTFDGSNENFETRREELYEKKKARKVFKSFFERSIKVLILTWNASRTATDLNADWIFYFDLPPDYMSYVTSLKCSNVTQNEQYFFVESTESDATKQQIQSFAELRDVLKQVLLKKNLFNEDAMRKSFRRTQMTEEELNEKYRTLITKEADLYSSISVVNRYCEFLPTDAFTRVAPRWTLHTNEDPIICRIQLPLQPSIRCVAETEPVKNVEVTKQIAALKAIKMLRELRHLDEEALPQLFHPDSDPSCDKALFPLWKDERDDFEAGTSNCFRVVPIAFPEWLYDCAPQPGCDCYVHVINLNPAYPEPAKNESRKKFVHELLKSREEFCIVTRKKLPDICQFPVFIDLGQVDVSIKVNAHVTRFTEQQVDKLFSFHRFLFLDVLQVVKRFLVADRSRNESSYVVAPVRIDDDGLVHLAWDVIDSAHMNDIEAPSDEERIHTDYLAKNYVGKVITPWYRVLPLKNYVVTKVLRDQGPSFPFTSDEYHSFTSYYSEKYQIDVKNPNQPLLEARAIPMNLNCVRPRARTAGIRRKLGEKETDFDEILMPELCVQQPFPAVYWYKSLMLLAVAHRLHYILVAEMIRQRVAAHHEQSSRLKSWPTDEIDVLEVDRDCVSAYEESSKKVEPIASILKDVKWAKRVRRYPWANEWLPVDVDRKLNTTNILEVMLQHDFMRNPDLITDPYPSSEHSKCDKLLRPMEEYPEFLKLERELSPGPKQRDIYQALTSVKCGDVVNFKSLKIIGRSFLKFAASLQLYRLYPDLNVLQLRRLRGKLIDKRNLFYCGSKLQLGSCLKLHDVNLDYDWNFGGFSIPKEILNAINESGIPPEVIFNLEIPRSEQMSGVLSAETRNDLHQRTLNYFNETSREESNFLTPESFANENNNHVMIHFNKQCVADKTVVDALKALTGAYLVNCGVEAGLKFLQYMEIIRSDTSLQELFVANSNESDLQDLYHQVFVARQFESRPLFVQAFTHHSCYPENSNECNQKLAFLGNALLDFLITAYVFEHRSPHMKNSDLEDVRIALVNDILFAIVLVRLNLHKHLLIQSPTLVEKVDKFVQQQQRVKHQVNDREYLFLVEETSHLITDKVDVPKILSDTFKALIAGIFLQSGDLKYVWRICYNFMWIEIDSLMHHAPENPVKLLEETDLFIEYEKPKSHAYDPTLRVVNMRVEIDKENLNFTGVGEDKQQAKLIAAKIALKEMSKRFTL